MSTMTAQTTQVYSVFILATPEQIWEAITKPEFTTRYFYGARIEVTPEWRRTYSPDGSDEWGEGAVLGVLVDPPVVDQADRHGVEEVELLPARSARDDETGLFEDAQVLHHAEARHLQLGLELGQRAAVTLEEPVEQEPARRIGECLEHAVVVVHAAENT